MDLPSAQGLSLPGLLCFLCRTIKKLQKSRVSREGGDEDTVRSGMRHLASVLREGRRV